MLNLGVCKDPRMSSKDTYCQQTNSYFIQHRDEHQQKSAQLKKLHFLEIIIAIIATIFIVVAFLVAKAKISDAVVQLRRRMQLQRKRKPI